MTGAEDGTRKIIVSFPVGLDIPDGWEYKLNRLVGELCIAWEKENPGYVMWPAGQGSLMTSNIYVEEPMTFDNSTYVVDVAMREAHENEERRDQRRRRRDATEMSPEQIDAACTVYLGLPALIDAEDVIMIHDLAKQALVLRTRVAELLHSLSKIDPSMLEGVKKPEKL